MTHRFLLASAFAIGVITAQGASAQAASAPATRAEVKADIPADRTQDAQISGERMPPAKQWKPKATGDNQPKTREQVKKETAEAAKKDKAPTKAGEGDTPVMAK